MMLFIIGDAIADRWKSTRSSLISSSIGVYVGGL